MNDLSSKLQEVIGSQSIKFKLNIEDLVKHQLFYLNHTKNGIQIRNKSRFQLLVLKAVLFFCLGLILEKIVLLQSGLWITLLLCGFGTLASYLYMIWNYPSVVRKMVDKMHQGSENKAIFCERILTASDGGLIHKTEYAETKISWGALEQIETEMDYTYLFFGSASAVVIPHKSITQGDLGSFLNAIKTHYKPGQLLEPATQPKLNV